MPATGFASVLKAATFALFVSLSLATAPSWAGGHDGSGGDGEEKEERKTVKTGAMSTKVNNLLAEAQALASPEDENAKPDFAGAQAKLDEIKAMPKLSDYEQAQLYNFYGFIYYSQERYQDSINAYQTVLSFQEIPPGLRNQITYTLAQLKFTIEEYAEAIQLIKDWLKNQENPAPDPYVLIATGYYQLAGLEPEGSAKAQEYMDQIIPNIERALAIAAERGTKPKEQWYLLLRVAYWDKGDMEKVREILYTLVANWPKKEYWAQLSAVYGELAGVYSDASGPNSSKTKKAEVKQLSSFANLYDQGLLSSNSDYVQAASLYLSQGAPYKGARILEEGIENGAVERNVKNLRLISQAWALAQENDKAIPPLKEAAKLSKDGELDIRLAQSYLNLSQYKSCISAARTGIKKGDINRADIANMILGMCLFETDDLSNAKAAFRNAAKDERSESSARQWLKYIQSEEDRIEQLEAAIASLTAAG